MNPPISVCIIGLNEEEKIEDCLRSVVEVADEIVYVDSYSGDKTVEIARKYTDRIVLQKFLGHVEQKNLAIDEAKHDWVLALDCDERLSPEAIAEIKAIWADQAEKIATEEIRAVRFNRLTYYIYRFIRHSGWYPDSKIRLFNRKYCRWQGENPHDIVHCDSKYLYKSKTDILHYSFDSISDHLKTIDSFSRIAAHEAYEKGKRVGLFSLVFRSLWVGVRKMFFEFAFLDGAAGVILTGLSIASTWAKYSRLYILCRHSKKP